MQSPVLSTATKNKANFCFILKEDATLDVSFELSIKYLISVIDSKKEKARCGYYVREVQRSNGGRN